jgi:CRP-like cAMP-binding protein
MTGIIVTGSPQAQTASMRPRSEQNFFELRPSDLAELLAHGRERSYKKGEPLFNEGDEPGSLYLLREGRVNLTKSSAEGGESLVAFHTAGETFCVAAAIINDPYPCKAVAATDVNVVAIPASQFNGLFERLPRFAKRLLRDMAPQFCAAHCDCALSMESVDKRLAHAVLRLDRQFQGGEIPFTRGELAQMVNTTVESSIRTLSAWDKQGWLLSGRGHFKLVKRAELEALIA